MARSSAASSTSSVNSSRSSESEYISRPSTPSSPGHNQHGHKLTGARKVHYQPHSAWDFVVSAEPSEPVDLDLMLPHYRAHNQPLSHRMSMYIRSQRTEIKAKICRRTRSPFLLRIDSSSSAPVTVYLPSDFSGTIRFPTRALRLSLSAGFTNTIRPRVKFSPDPRQSDAESVEDEVEIHAAGPVQLRMWDVLDGAPESAARETWRKFCRRASSKNLHGHAETRPADWDFLLDD